MIPDPAPLVMTKLRVPASRQRIVARERLTSLLSMQQDAGVILVCAPAGYGKTTVLATWAKILLDEGTAVAWIALDPSDDDPIPFGAYLAACFTQALGTSPSLTQIAQRLRASPELDLQRIMPELINILGGCGRRCMLILDDYHLISSPAVHSAVAYLIDHRPENLRVAIGSRADPPLPLARLRARGDLLELRTAHLRLSLDEAALFLRGAVTSELPMETIAALEARTEGWVTGLQLASLAMQAFSEPGKDQPAAVRENILASFSGSHHYLADYLMEEVIDRQPRDVQDFLLSTSILDRMSAGLCDAVRQASAEASSLDQRRGSSDILRQMEKANLFVIALDEQGGWFRYHHLFRDFLFSRLHRLKPQLAARLNRAASDWLVANGHLREAASHIFQAQDWDFSAAFVEQHSFSLILHSEIATIYEWCSIFPEAIMLRHPMLCLMQGLALAYNFRGLNRPRVEYRLRQAAQAIALMDDRQAAGELEEMAAVVETFLSMAPNPYPDPLSLITLSERLVAPYPEEDPGRFTGTLFNGYAQLALPDAVAAGKALESARTLALRGGLYFGIVETTFHLARLAYCQGMLHRSAELCRLGQAEISALLPDAEQTLPALGCLDVALGCVMMEQNQLEEAERCLRRGLEQMGWGMNPFYLMTAYTALFHLCHLQDRLLEAEKYLSQLDEIWPDIKFCTNGLRAVYALRRAPKDTQGLVYASSWLKVYSPSPNGKPLPGMGPIGAAEAYYLADLSWIEAQIALENPREALNAIQSRLEFAKARSLNTRVIELSLLKAKACHAEGNLSGARQNLQVALVRGEPEGYLRVFDRGQWITQLLYDAARDGIHVPYIERILSTISWGRAATNPSQRELHHSALLSSDALVEPLSDREMDVLRLMVPGSTNQAIADTLFITVGTVKSHINHILGKLGARNRTEAVARARQMGIIEG